MQRSDIEDAIAKLEEVLTQLDAYDLALPAVTVASAIEQLRIELSKAAPQKILRVIV